MKLRPTLLVLVGLALLVGAGTWVASASSTDNWDRGDINCDRLVGAGDALELLKYYAGLPNDLPAGCPPIGPSPSPTATPPSNQLPPPQETGHVDAGGRARITISNDSPYTLSVDFSGPQTQHQDMAECPDCIEWVIKPIFCPEDGPQLTIDLEPGTYNVEVNSGKSGILPFRGTWTLEPDTGYFECFIILKSFGS